MSPSANVLADMFHTNSKGRGLFSIPCKQQSYFDRPDLASICNIRSIVTSHSLQYIVTIIITENSVIYRVCFCDCNSKTTCFTAAIAATILFHIQHNRSPISIF